ncbi:MAG: ketopantoate reductase family protein [Euryarchaeota archaeon TMED99]|nr:MAG: ketopantoate reductase family protein [Euryarchaeota archaeon TMED99]|tara:strand:- start:1278 stop:2213 length:936 start_codon:yes stop_codon:yes gene_type:complete
MRIAVLGAGSLGSLYAALLSRVDGVELLIHGQGPHGAHMTAHGLQLEGEETHFVSNSEVFFSLEEVGLPEPSFGTIDFALLTGKAGQTSSLAQLAHRLLNENGMALCLSNGLGHAEQCIEILGPQRVFAATSTHGAWRPSAGVVNWAGKGQTVLGSLPGGPGETEAKPLLDALSSAGLEPVWSSDGFATIWKKVLLNIAINPLAALAGVENGALLEPDLFSSAFSTMLEGAAVARTERVNLPDDAELELLLRQVLTATASNICSMLQDIRAGRSTEIAVLNQAITARGERAGIATPLNQMLTSMIKALHPQ